MKRIGQLTRLGNCHGAQPRVASWLCQATAEAMEVDDEGEGGWRKRSDQDVMS